MKPDNHQTGFIVADAIYTLDTFKRRLGLGEAALRRARGQGLVIHRVGRRAYVIGADAIDWIRGKTRGGNGQQ